MAQTPTSPDGQVPGVDPGWCVSPTETVDDFTPVKGSPSEDTVVATASGCNSQMHPTLCMEERTIVRENPSTLKMRDEMEMLDKKVDSAKDDKRTTMDPFDDLDAVDDMLDSALETARASVDDLEYVDNMLESGLRAERHEKCRRLLSRPQIAKPEQQSSTGASSSREILQADPNVTSTAQSDGLAVNPHAARPQAVQAQQQEQEQLNRTHIGEQHKLKNKFIPNPNDIHGLRYRKQKDQKNLREAKRKAARLAGIPPRR